jgi:hypothetical protein
MLKSVSIGAALILAAAVCADSAEARPGGFGSHSVGGFKGVGGGSGRMMGMGSGRPMGMVRPMGMGSGRPMGMVRPMGMSPGRVAWANRGNRSGNRWAGNWSGNRWAGNWHRGHFRRGGFWPWWGVGAGVALAAATWPYYGGYGYDSCVQWVPDYGWVNVCSDPYYGGYGYY